jgi:hypothetical protein
MRTTLSAKAMRTLPELIGKQEAITLNYSEWRLINAKPDDQIEIDLSSVTETTLQLLAEKLDRGEVKAMRLIKRMVRMLNDPMGKIPKQGITSLASTIATFMQKHLEENPNCFYLARIGTQKGVAYLPLSVEQFNPTKIKRNGYSRSEEPHATLTLGYNLNGSYSETKITFNAGDLGVTIPEMLRANGYIMMFPDDIKTYSLVKSRYEKYLEFDKQQMLAIGQATSASRRSWWEDEDTYDLSPGGTPTKVVIDFDKSRHAERVGMHSDIFGAQVRVPTHPLVPVFSLAHHTHLWVNVTKMKPYVYESLKDELILPPSHTRLIEALVTNLDTLKGVTGASRVLAAKTKANVILSMGPPGTGKTLTAEVFAEEIKRPLYEVASGQLGVDAKSIESALSNALDLSIRLKMPLLINEADVFIRERGTDMRQNAVCATFLRLLEYHTGLVFLTTNITAIDDALRSRCIAEIVYGIPGEDERRSLWGVQLKQFGVKLSDKEVDKLVRAMPKTVGRDIQNVLKLTVRFALATSQEVTAKLIMELSVFKGIEIKEK